MSRRTPLHRSKARARPGAPLSSRALWPDTSERPGLQKRRMWRLRREKPPSAVVRIDRSASLRRERLGAERPGALQEPWRPHHGTAAIAGTPPASEEGERIPVRDPELRGTKRTDGSINRSDRHAAYEQVTT